LPLLILIREQGENHEILETHERPENTKIKKSGKQEDAVEETWNGGARIL
jgi:hypothetical protein